MGSGRASGSKKGKKRSKARKDEDEEEDEEEPTPPSVKRWNEMVTFKTFVVHDSEGKPFRFEEEKVALILPHGFDPEEQHDITAYWFGKIKEIRADPDVDDSRAVWIKVQWYYSGSDVADVVKSFNPKGLGKYERIFSDHHDFVRPEAFDAKITVYKFDENDCEQRYIPTDSFYRRYNFEYRARNLQPKPGKSTCFCQVPYNPDDENPLSLIHFCPRPSCRRGYHHRCLTARKSKDSSIASSSKLSLTTKIPNFPTADRAMGVRDAVVVQRSARKRAIPRRKSRLSLRVRKQPQMDEAAQVVKIVFPGSPSPGDEAVQERHPLSPPVTPTMTQSISLSARHLRLFACSPDSDETLDLAALLPKEGPDDILIDTDDERNSAGEESETSSRPPSRIQQGKRTQQRTNKNKTTTTTPIRSGSGSKGTASSLTTALSTVPADLLRVAIQPLVRGGAFCGGGVAGNIGMVTHARRLIYAALQMGGGPGSVPDEWEDLVFGDDRKAVKCGIDNAIVSLIDDDHDELDSLSRDDAGEALPPFVCINCQSAI